MNSSHQVHSLSVNDEGTLFSACTDSGVTIYNMEPLVSKLRIDVSQIGSVALCSLLHRTNLIAIVGGGNRQKFSENTVLIWDDSIKQFVLEFVFGSKVLAIRTRRDRLFIVERKQISCFTFPNQPKKLFTIETGDNPNGMCEVTPLTSATELQLVAYPGHRMGSVQLLDLSTTWVVPQNGGASMEDSSTAIPSSSISPTSVSAHQSEIACMALNRNGTLLATASRKGTLIRIFRTTDLASGRGSSSYIPLSPEKVVEFRRGMDTATLYCIVFSPDSEYVLASSDKGTVHIFALSESRLNRRSALPTLVNGEYSVARFTLPAECACVCAFGADRRSVYSICVDGSYHKYMLKKDGTCERDNFDNYLEAHEETEHLL